MNNIYIPNYSNNNCVVVYDKDTLRVYESRPTNNSSVNYRDIYINSNYIEKTGTQTFNQYNALPTCLSSDIITDQVYYRNDFDKIMVIVFIMIILLFYFPYRIISRLFGRWFKI